VELNITQLKDFLSPLGQELQACVKASSFAHLFHNINEERLANTDVVILSVDELVGNESTYSDSVRKTFYELFIDKKACQILDAGALKKGNSHADTVRCLQDVYSFFQSKGIPVIIIGCSNYILSYLSSYQRENNYKCATIVSNSLGVDIDESVAIGPLPSFLNNSNLRSYVNHLGSQIFLNSKESFDYCSQNKVNVVRLGIARENIEKCEPYFRDSQFHLFDFESLKNSDMPAQKKVSPNGFYGEEICQMAWYAGISDFADVICLSNFYAENDEKKVATNLFAQVIWHAVDGILQRSKNNPFYDEEKFEMYVVSSDNKSHDLVFYRGENNRWWIKIDDGYHVKYCACTENDYRLAQKNCLPDVWVNHL